MIYGKKTAVSSCGSHTELQETGSKHRVITFIGKYARCSYIEDRMTAISNPKSIGKETKY